MLIDTTRTQSGWLVGALNISRSAPATTAAGTKTGARRALLIVWVTLETLQGNRPGSQQSENENQSLESCE
jgi:hypothetical protein